MYNAIKKILSNAMLLLAFFCLLLSVILQFTADVSYRKARELDKLYRWKRAKEKYQLSVKLNPYNSLYLDGLGGILLKQNTSDSNKSSLLKKADTLYRKALRLNPLYSEYWLRLGKVQLEKRKYAKNSSWKISSSKKLNKKDPYLYEAMQYFQKVLENDPFGFNTSYTIGSFSLPFWQFFNNSEKEFISKRLNYCSSLKRKYNLSIYPLVWKHTKDFHVLKSVTPSNLKSNILLYSFIDKNNLWQFRKEQKRILDFFKQKEEPAQYEQERSRKLKKIEMVNKNAGLSSPAENYISKNDWKSITKDGVIVNDNCKLRSERTVHGIIHIPAEKSLLKIQMRSSQAKGIYSYVFLELDGKEIGGFFVNSLQWKEYSLRINTTGGIKVLSITFLNDFYDKKTGEDRNLYIGRAFVKNIK